MSTSKQPAARPKAQSVAKAGPGAGAKTGAGAEPAYVEPPPSIVVAAKLMYAGAALTALEVIVYTVYVATTHTIAAAAPHATAAQVHATKTTLISANAFAGLIEIGLWIFLARANRAGLAWARKVASVLVAFNTILLVTALAGGAVTRQAFTAVTWLIGAAAVYFLWRRESSDYFSIPAAPAPSAGPGRAGSAGPAGSAESAKPGGSGKAGGS